ncbi:glycosyl hydrolase 2 galactose-binding domain-containing protein [Emticicia sp. BO119]|uniref:glycoside hydrolase family 2 protein n=1 Tax=Emticicia sp. BO119 TaxID=2757768 RepID=UPI0015F09593|nr:glycoside hydrolase family 2 TIM barrel-domain containing protein [Emticicia sp. BO119]MBA4848924.1 glycoside hydrolase family 2 [Emticicia sp. BO119]
MNQRWCLLLGLLSSFFLISCGSKVKVEEMTLSNNWTIASTKEVNADARTLSIQLINPEKWVKATVPTTVLGALVEAGIYKDPFMGKNLENIPRAPFENSWWFRNTFEIENLNIKDEHLTLLIDGINYRADFWLNGVKVATQDTLFGAFRQFEIDITEAAKSGENVLLVEVFPPQVRNFYMGFVDWAPTPPDHYMGIYRDIRIKRSGKVPIMVGTFIAPDLDPKDLTRAWLTISTELANHSDVSKTVELKGTIENLTFTKSFTLAPHERKEVKFTPADTKQLLIKNPRLWWPNGLGNPEMYTLNLEVRENGSLSDKQSTRFGIRKIETYLNDKGVRGYKVNGREVLIKSAGWVDDLFLRYMPEKDAAQIRYVKEMNLNSLRFEGVWGNNHHIYDLCDENGILLMIGWSCQWEWPDYLGMELKIKPGDENLPINEGVDLYAVKLTPEEESLLSNYLRDQVKWLRNHPSIFTWAGGSDAMPKPSLEKRYLATLKQYDPTRPFLISSGDFNSELTGKSGMKMNGPYEYVPPVYWYEDKKLGGAFGFNSETGPGPQIPPVSSIKKMIPEADLWPPDNKVWNYHSGRKDFNTMGVYLNAMNKRYGTPKNLEELALKSQLMNYEAIRPMFEAFVINRPMATGVVQWMLNSPWPEFYWQLYDYYLMPTGAYYGTKKAAQPVNIIYDYHNHAIHLSNDTRQPLSGLKAEIKLYDKNSKQIFEKTESQALKKNTTKKWLSVPVLKGKNEVYFLSLTLKNAKGDLIADNFYWLSSQKDQLDWSKYFWFYTPQKQYADFSGLNTLPKVSIKAEKNIKEIGKDEYELSLILKNTSDKLAFFIEAELADGANGDAITPVFWSDNYISIPPNDMKKIKVRYFKKDLKSGKPVIRIQGYNLLKSITL